LPLGQFNVDTSNFEAQISVTSLPDDGGVSIQSLLIYLSDGLNLFGGFFSARPNNTAFTDVRRDELSNDGQSLILREFLGRSSNAPVTANSSYLITIGVQTTATNTTITGDINNGAAALTPTTPTLFDPSNGGLSLVVFSNIPNQNYLINSVTFTRGVSAPTAVVEPKALGGLMLGLATLGFGLYRRRFI